MKAWQCANNATPPVKRKVDDPSAMIARMILAFRVHGRFWRAIGSKSPRICQFIVRDAKIPSWFVKLAPDGAEVIGGEHPRPDAVFEADASSFVKLMRGEAGGELLEEKRVAVRGDLDALSRLFEGLKAPI
jgi:predicted lipid carrier protein YhbT